MNSLNDSTDKANTWLSLDEACEILNLSKKRIKNRCYAGDFIYKTVKENKKTQYYISSDSLILKEKKAFSDKEDLKQVNHCDAPEWAKGQARKYANLLRETDRLKGENLKEFIELWNIAHNDKTSYTTLIRMRRKYVESGINGLLAKYGTNAQKTCVPDKYFDYFKVLYLKEGAPSLRTCYESTLGYASRTDGVLRINFPSYMAFFRRLKKEIPEGSIYLARYGKSAWNVRYGKYIERDYSSIKCGEVWVSDHAQLDIACLSEEGDIIFPWITAWRDYKSGKWLGWILQCGHPNSDHIFQTFYYAARAYGLPKDVIIDNGKDYRCKDFAGGRKIVTDKQIATTMLSELNVDVHFALPYNAQTKPIERDFRKIKEELSKHSRGYRGGNVVERPEKLAKEIKEGKLLIFEQLKAIFDDYVINCLNKKCSMGKNLQGLSPDELFNQECTEIIKPSNDALKLFCMRTSRDFSIGRNGISDKQLGITYWGDWMINCTKLKVYLRRDPENYKVAWAFNSATGEFLGVVNAVRAVAALHADKISKEEFKEAMSIKKRNYKITRSFILHKQEVSLDEHCENYKAAYASVEKSKKPKVSILANTNMDKAIRKNKEMQAQGKYDLSMFLDETPYKEEELFLFETDKLLKEELQGVVNGY